MVGKPTSFTLGFTSNQSGSCQPDRQFHRLPYPAQRRLIGCAVGPKSAAGFPVFPETGIMRHGILNDQRLNALRVSKSQAKANWPTIVLHVEAVMRQAERLGKMLHHGRNVVEGVR